MENHETVIVIGGGESVKAMNVGEICKRGYAIGVNGASVHAPVDCGVSMDRKWAEEYHENIKDKPFYLRKAKVKFPLLKPFSCDHESDVFSATEGKLNGRNSGFCAFNLAYQMSPKTIYLFGFDMGGGYWHPRYPWKDPKEGSHKSKEKAQAQKARIYDCWVSGFDVARRLCEKKGIKVYVVGKSKINSFTKITYEKFLELEGVKK